MSLKTITKKLHDAVVDEDVKLTPTEKVTANIAPPATNYTLHTTLSPFCVPQTVAVDETVYQKVLAKTDFATTAVGMAVQKYYDALDEMPDQDARFRLAVKQAQKLDGVSPEKIVAAFDDLKTALQAEINGFKAYTDKVTAQEITARQTTVQQLIDQIAKLQEQLHQTQNDLAAIQTRVQNGAAQFDMAVQRRASEIEQQRVRFQNLLLIKGI